MVKNKQKGHGYLELVQGKIAVTLKEQESETEGQKEREREVQAELKYSEITKLRPTVKILMRLDSKTLYCPHICPFGRRTVRFTDDISLGELFAIFDSP